MTYVIIIIAYSEIYEKIAWSYVAKSFSMIFYYALKSLKNVTKSIIYHEKFKVMTFKLTHHQPRTLLLTSIVALLASSTILTCTQKVGPDGQPLRLYGLGPVCQFFTKSSEYHKLVPYTAYANLIHDQTFIENLK